MNPNQIDEERSARNARTRRGMRLALEVLSGFHEASGDIPPGLMEDAMRTARKQSGVGRSRLRGLIR